MFDVWLNDIELTEVIINVSVVLVIALQVLLCFKVKKVVIKLLPIIILLIVAAFLLVMAQFSSGWDNLGYLILAIFVGIMLLACAIGWIVWLVTKVVGKVKR